MNTVSAGGGVLEAITPGEEWSCLPMNFGPYFFFFFFCVIFTLDRACFKENSVALISEVRALIDPPSPIMVHCKQLWH